MPGGAEKDARSVMSTAIHEIGHVVQFMDETKDDKLGIRLWADKKLTRYSGTNDMEAFAEGFVAFVTQPERLKQMRPKLYDRIRRSLNEYMA
jgi:Mlc titration factor MtfA (ptsG expression regulator)